MKNQLKPKWLSDKQTHALYGLVIFLLLWWLIGIHFALVSTIAVAGAVEIYDHVSGKGTPEWADFWCTVILPIIIYTLSSVFYSLL